MNPLGRFGQRRVEINSIKPISKIQPYPPVERPPAPPKSVKPLRDGIDCDFADRCKEYDKVVVAYCRTCMNNRAVKKESYYRPIPGAEV